MPALTKRSTARAAAVVSAVSLASALADQVSSGLLRGGPPSRSSTGVLSAPDAVLELRQGAKSIGAKTPSILSNHSTNHVSLQDPDEEDARVVNGQVVAEGTYPFFVQGNGCGGSLILPDVVLTAAHCRDAYHLISSIIVGNSEYGMVTTGAQRRDIASSMRIHPQYDPVLFSHDFMLFKIEPVTEPGLVPVTLNSDSSNPGVGDNVTIIGFGATEEGSGINSRLLDATLHIVSNQDCEEKIHVNLPTAVVDDSMLCAGYNPGEEPTDSCQGDSGGPLIDASRKLVGVVSWGVGCARPDIPGAYSRVSDQLNWIKENACDLTSDSSSAFCFGVGPPDSQAPTPTPGGEDPGTALCSDLGAAFVQCIYSNNGDLDTCLNCIQSYSGPYYPTSESSCSAYSPYLCGEMENCPSCGPCLPEDVEWTNCLLESTCSEPYSCPAGTPDDNGTGTDSPAPTPSPTAGGDVASFTSAPTTTPTGSDDNGEVPTPSPTGNIGTPSSLPTIEAEIDASTAAPTPDPDSSSCWWCFWNWWN
jgi:trypsin